MGEIDAPGDCEPGAEAQDVALAQHAIELLGDNPVVEVVAKISKVADQPPMIALSAATLAAGLVAGNPRLAGGGVRMLAAHALATGIKAVIKKRVNRTRPFLLMEEDRYETGGEGRDEKDVNSFPSGHTAGIVAVAGALGQSYPQARLPAYGIAATLAAVQVPRGAHYPIDVAVGAAIGWAAQALVGRAISAFRTRR